MSQPEKRQAKNKRPPAAEANAPAEPAATPAATEESSVESDLAALTDRLLRLQADFNNYRKRVQRDQAESRLRSLEALMTDLLPALDHFELGLRNAAEAGLPEATREGLALVCDQFHAVLSKHGLRPIDAQGQPFDPDIHESVSAVASGAPRDTVVDQIRRGYRLGDLLLRPAQVVLSAGADATP